MTTTDPAATLRAASERLRELAGAATPGPWVVHSAKHGYAVSRFNAESERVTSRTTLGTGRYIAAMSPPVALALADWLNRAANFAHRGGVTAESLAVARAILGGDA